MRTGVPTAPEDENCTARDLRILRSILLPRAYLGNNTSIRSPFVHAPNCRTIDWDGCKMSRSTRVAQH
jgi:hypothetical protein